MTQEFLIREFLNACDITSESFTYLGGIEGRRKLCKEVMGTGFGLQRWQWGKRDSGGGGQEEKGVKVEQNWKYIFKALLNLSKLMGKK